MKDVAAGTIDEYAKALGDWRGEVVGELDAMIRRTAPKATGSIKWAQPVYEQDGPFAYVKAFTSAVNFGFWRGADLADADGRLEGTGDRMRHVKIRGPATSTWPGSPPGSRRPSRSTPRRVTPRKPASAEVLDSVPPRGYPSNACSRI